MTKKYDTEILSIIGREWCESKTWIWKKIGVKVNKKHIFDNIDYLVTEGYLEKRHSKNRTQYRRNDIGDSETNFLEMMKVFEWNQKTELDKIKRLDKITKFKGKKLTKDGKDLLDHIQDQVDRAYTVIIRMSYQAQLKVITQRTANERTKQLQKHIDKIMIALTNKYKHDSIKEYFQNHVKNLEFKI